MSAGIRLRTALDKSCRPLDGEFLTTVLVEITPPRRADRLPLNLGILVDTSESMQNEKLARAKDACQALIAQLDPGDSFCLISFASHAHVLIPSVTRSEASTTDIAAVLATLKAEGVTSLLRGLDDVFREVRRRAGPERTSFVLLLSDGYPTTTQGYVDEHTSPYIQRVDREMRERGVSLTTIGLGDAANYDQAFLRRLGDAGNGQFYYCSSPALLAEQFATELGRIQNTVLSQVGLTVKHLKGKVRRLWRVFPDKKLFDTPDLKAGSFGVPLGSFQDGRTQAFLVDVVTTAEQARPGRERLLEVEATWSTGGDARSASTTVVFELTDDERALAQRNMEVVHLATECLDALLEDELETAVSGGDVTRQTSVLARKKQLTMRLGKTEATRVLEEMEDSLSRGESISQDALARSSQATRPTQRLG
ncbi:MAG: VWA domain-containing protein [Armatimonadetes bacterium]|nr:VWA domain-containing protein [Armatimonadota bacterium]